VELEHALVVDEEGRLDVSNSTAAAGPQYTQSLLSGPWLVPSPLEEVRRMCLVSPSSDTFTRAALTRHGHEKIMISSQ